MKKHNKISNEAWALLLDEIIIKSKEIKSGEWLTLEDKPIHQEMFKNLGIKYFHPGYLETNETQNHQDELNKINNFLNSYLYQYALSHYINVNTLNIEFINYGKTELVYVLTINSEPKFTILVKQPVVPFGKVKEEVNNLLTLQEKDSQVIAPIDYYCDDEYELYVTPYINQARCIASSSSWGIYVPEPYYRFVPFSKEQESIVNTCMIAKLVSLYDHEAQEGLCACKLGGGDFMLPKNWEDTPPTIETTLESIMLIAAREKIKCSLREYIDIIKREFSKKTIDENQSTLVINHRGRVPMNIEDIENGIKLGQEILNNIKKLQKSNIK